MSKLVSIGDIAEEKPKLTTALPHVNMARHRYLVTYDISHPKRLRNVAKTCQEYGTRIQYSVFECPLDELRLIQLKTAIDTILNHDEDQVLFISLGPVNSKNPMRIESIGQPYTMKSRVTII